MTKKRIEILIFFVLLFSVVATFFFPKFIQFFIVIKQILIFSFLSYITYLLINFIRNKLLVKYADTMNHKTVTILNLFSLVMFIGIIIGINFIQISTIEENQPVFVYDYYYDQYGNLVYKTPIMCADSEITIIKNTSEELLISVIITKNHSFQSKDVNFSEEIYGIVDISLSYENGRIINMSNQTTIQQKLINEDETIDKFYYSIEFSHDYEYDINHMLSNKSYNSYYNESASFEELSDISHYNFQNENSTEGITSSRDYTYELTLTENGTDSYNYIISDVGNNDNAFEGHVNISNTGRELYLTFSNDFDIWYEYEVTNQNLIYTEHNSGAQFIRTYEYNEETSSYVFLEYDGIQGESYFSIYPYENQFIKYKDSVYVDSGKSYYYIISQNDIGTKIAYYEYNLSLYNFTTDMRTYLNMQAFYYMESFGVNNKENFMNDSFIILNNDPMIKYLLDLD